MKKSILASVIVLSACASKAPGPESASVPVEPAKPRHPAADAKRYSFDGNLGEVAKAFTEDRNAMDVKELSDRYTSLTANNLHDTGSEEGDPAACKEVMKTLHRTADGSCYFADQKQFNKLNRMGSNDARFGRNSRPLNADATKSAVQNLLEPNPRLVSRELFTRKNGEMIPVPSLNLLAAAWLQAENHDWFSHGKNVTPQSGRGAVRKHGAAYGRYFEFIQVPPVPGDSEFPTGLRVPRTRPDLTSTDRHGFPLVYRNVVTHWWDASQIYGSDAETIARVRTNPMTGQKYTGGFIAVDEANRRLYYDQEGLPITGFTDNWWVGLELFHTLFALEHNSVARLMKAKYPQMSDDEIFEKSRLVVAALIAKIHSVEWTPALLDNKLLHIGMYANWNGLRKIKSARWSELLGKMSKNVAQTMNGIVGGANPDLANVPYSLTEEFVAVYRMHPLIPDFVESREMATPGSVRRIPLQDTAFEKAGKILADSSSSSLNMMYSFLTSHPGALSLDNFPKFMQNIDVPGNTEGMPKIQLDLATIDILRDRERLVPRYNEFRRQLKLKPLKTFADLTTDKDIVARLERVYEGDVEKLDLLVGTLAEADRLQGFAFGTTPFAIFQLMASRRLLADPFFRTHYNAEVYTQEGLDWVDQTDMRSVITRHFPEMKPKLKGVSNAFHPWND